MGEPISGLAGARAIVTARFGAPITVAHEDENSDVLPDGSVAVAVTNSPAVGAAASVTLNGALPLPSVVAVNDPR